MASVAKLKVDSSEFEAKIKRASQGITRLSEDLRQNGKSFADADKEQLAFIKELGKMETVSKDARGRVNELSKAFVDLSAEYKHMTDAEKNSPAGKELAKGLEQLKQRAIESKKELAEFSKQLEPQNTNNFNTALGELGNRFGINSDLMNTLTTGTVAYTAAIGAAVAIVGKAADAFAKYNTELAKQDQITQVTTGLSGGGADRMTDQMRALSDTYKVDFRDAINAANTLMSQFGETGDSAVRIIKDGMQGMIQGDGPKLLSMIQQYAPAFQSAGVSASELVAVIQNSEGGIFTDQNMQAIVMGIKNIRLMATQTSEALAKMGIDGQDMSRKMNDGSMTVFDALKLVAGQLKNVDSNSKVAGEVMQTVFGRQGAMAGTNIAKAIDSLNTNLAETKKQTGEVGEAFAELQIANEKLNKAIRDCFEYDGWDRMSASIKGGLISSLAEVLTLVKQIGGAMKTFLSNGTWGEILANFKGNDITGSVANAMKREQAQAMASDLQSRMKSLWPFKGGGGGGTSPEPSPTKPTGKTGGGAASTVFDPTSIAYQEQLVSELTKKWREAGDAVRDDYKKQLDEAKQVLAVMNGGFDPSKVGEMNAPAADLADMKRGKDWKWYDSTKPEAPKELKLSEGLQKTLAYLQKQQQDKKEVNLSQEMTQIVGSVNGMLSGIQQLGIDLPQGLQEVMGGIQGMISILTSISTIITAIEAISAADAIIPFANGGIVPHAAGGYFVPGTHFSNDVTPIMANAGELVLNRAQQGALAGQLQGTASNIHMTASVQGEQIILAANRTFKRKGQGEIVTWKN